MMTSRAQCSPEQRSTRSLFGWELPSPATFQISWSISHVPAGPTEGWRATVPAAWDRFQLIRNMLQFIWDSLNGTHFPPNGLQNVRLRNNLCPQLFCSNNSHWHLLREFVLHVVFWNPSTTTCLSGRMGRARQAAPGRRERDRSLF